MPHDTDDTDDTATPRETDAIEKHEDLDADTLLDDAVEFFAPDNDQIPPPSPDAPPPDR